MNYLQFMKELKNKINKQQNEIIQQNKCKKQLILLNVQWLWVVYYISNGVWCGYSICVCRDSFDIEFSLHTSYKFTYLLMSLCTSYSLNTEGWKQNPIWLIWLLLTDLFKLTNITRNFKPIILQIFKDNNFCLDWDLNLGLYIKMLTITTTSQMKDLGENFSHVWYPSHLRSDNIFVISVQAWIFLFEHIKRLKQWVSCSKLNFILYSIIHQI